MDFIKKNKLYIGLAGCALMLIAVFLPFATVKFFGLEQSVSFVEGWEGKFILALSVVSGLLLWFKKEKYSLISTGIILLLDIYAMINLKSQLKGFSSLAHLGIGPWFILIGVVAAAGVVVFQILEEKGKIK